MKENDKIKVIEHKDYEIIRCINGHLSQNCYFIRKKNLNEGIIIDPGLDISLLLSIIEENKYNICMILLTHGHFDHTYSTDLIRKRYFCDAYIQKEDSELMTDPMKNMSKSFFKNLQINDFKILEDEKFNIGNYNIKYLHTKGHTKGSVCYLFDDILFSGDTLFYSIYGRTDLYGGDFKEIEYSLFNIIFKLDDNILVLPGHGKETTIGYERKNNEILNED